MPRRLLILTSLALFCVSFADATPTGPTGRKHKFLGVVYQEPGCGDAQSSLGEVLVIVYNADFSIYGTQRTVSEPVSKRGSFQVKDLVEGEIYHYEFALDGYASLVGTFQQPPFDYQLSPCFPRTPLAVEPTSWGRLKAIYDH